MEFIRKNKSKGWRPKFRIMRGGKQIGELFKDYSLDCYVVICPNFGLIRLSGDQNTAKRQAREILKSDER